MAEVNINLKCDLQHAVKVQYLDGNLFSQDAAANTINIEVTDNGAPATIGGTVSANVIRPDGGTVAVTGGTISGNIVSITLPAACYALVGMISVIVKLTSDSTETTIAALTAYVYQSSTDTVVDPGTVISSIQDLIDAIDTAVASIPADYSSLWTSLAPAFSSSTSYTAGQYVTYNGGLYRFTKAHAAGSWASGDVVAVNLGGELSDVKSAMNIYDCALANSETEVASITDAMSKTGYGCNSSGVMNADANYTASDYILIPKGWTLAYNNLRSASTVNVVSVYSAMSESAYISADSVQGSGAGTKVSGTYTPTSNVYVRITSRTSNISEVSLSLTSILYRNNVALLSTIGLIGSDIKSKISNTGAISTSGVADTSVSSCAFSDYIFVPKGWDIVYSGLGISSSYNIISFYSATNEASYVSGVAGSGASTLLSGTYHVPADGYIRISTRRVPESVMLTFGALNKHEEIIKFVATTGNDTNDGNTFATSYKTIAKAMSEKATTIILDGGTYTENIIQYYGEIPVLKIYGNGSTIQDSGIDIRATNIEIYDLYCDQTGLLNNEDYSNSSGFFFRNSNVRLVRCKATNCPYMGFRLDGSKAILEDCYVNNVGVDGYNAHDTGTSVTNGLFINCEAYNCGDDGMSFHENGTIKVIGGKYCNNTSTGIAPHNNCNCEIHDAYIATNGRAGIEALVGNVPTLPDPLPTMVMTGCIFENNVGNAVTAEHYHVKACANGASGNGTNSIVDGGSADIETFALMQ